MSFDERLEPWDYAGMRLKEQIQRLGGPTLIQFRDIKMDDLTLEQRREAPLLLRFRPPSRLGKSGMFIQHHTSSSKNHCTVEMRSLGTSQMFSATLLLAHVPRLPGGLIDTSVELVFHCFRISSLKDYPIYVPPPEVINGRPLRDPWLRAVEAAEKRYGRRALQDPQVHPNGTRDPHLKVKYQDRTGFLVAELLKRIKQ